MIFTFEGGGLVGILMLTGYEEVHYNKYTDISSKAFFSLSLK